MAPLSSKFLEILRTTLSRVETQADLKPDDPTLVEFKRSVVRSVATMEAVASDDVEEKEEEYGSDLEMSA